MSRLAYLRQGLDRAWESLAEGWHQSCLSASQVITQFHLLRKPKDELRSVVALKLSV